jgi:hypothetical protein
MKKINTSFFDEIKTDKKQTYLKNTEVTTFDEDIKDIERFNEYCYQIYIGNIILPLATYKN